jgi:hypothetical protein
MFNRLIEVISLYILVRDTATAKRLGRDDIKRFLAA